MTYVSVVQTARNVGELDRMVWELSVDGYRVVTVLKNDVGDYVIVAQKERENNVGGGGGSVQNPGLGPDGAPFFLVTSGGGSIAEKN